MSLKNLSIGKRLGFSFGLIIFLFVISILTSYLYLSNASEKTRQVQKESLPLTLIAGRMALDVAEVQQWLTDVSATRDREGYKDADKYAKEFKDGLAKFQQMFTKENDTKGLERLAVLDSDFNDFYSMGKKMAEAYVNEGLEAGNTIMEDFDKVSDNIITKVAKFRKTQEEEIKGFTNQIMENIGFVLIILFSLGGVSIIFSILIAFLMSRSMIKAFRNINQISETIVIGSSQVSESAQSVAQGASEQASSTEEISSSIIQLNSQSKEAANNAQRAQGFSTEAMANAEDGEKKMKGMLISIQAIDESSKSISKIMKTIDEIAFQTNLLALNAAVEAARAGQHGKGFAVVAEEVNNLSKRSATAARETADIIEESLRKIKDGIVIASETEAAFQKILLAIGDVSKLTEEISVSSLEQVKGIEQVEKGVQEIDSVVQQNASAAEQNAASSEELTGQAREMQGIVAHFLGNSGNQANKMKKGIRSETWVPQKIEQEDKKVEKREKVFLGEPKGRLVKPEDIIGLDDRLAKGKSKEKDFDNF